MSAMAGASMAAYGIALYAAHHVGDYWVQTDHQAAHKGDQGATGIRECSKHVGTYVLTQAVCVGITALALDLPLSFGHLLVAMLVSGVTHYLADRREFGIMFKLARLIPGKGRFLKLGVPREPITLSGSGRVLTDNPSLGTGGWALDQAWHIFWGVFVAALVLGAGS